VRLSVGIYTEQWCQGRPAHENLPKPDMMPLARGKAFGGNGGGVWRRGTLPTHAQGPRQHLRRLRLVYARAGRRVRWCQETLQHAYALILFNLVPPLHSHAPYLVSMIVVIVAPRGSARLQRGHAAMARHNPSLRVHRSNQAAVKGCPHPVQGVSRLHRAVSMATVQ
jgi:hypothetical protein